MLAQQLYNDLINDGIVSAQGLINFELLNIRVPVQTKGVVGDIVQEWLQNYLTRRGYNFSSPQNTQEFPDFHLHSSVNAESELLEVKCFQASRGPGFDISNFQAYCNSLLTHPERLNSKYLIFSYSMSGEAVLRIENVWLKNVWEICGPSADWPLKLQVKNGVIYNIRPITWYSSRSTFRPFEDMNAFLEAINTTLRRYTTTHSLWRSGWLDQVRSGYAAL